MPEYRVYRQHCKIGAGWRSRPGDSVGPESAARKPERGGPSATIRRATHHRATAPDPSNRQNPCVQQPRQLAPLTKHGEAREGKLGEHVFARLRYAKRHPAANVQLRLQLRRFQKLKGMAGAPDGQSRLAFVERENREVAACPRRYCRSMAGMPCSVVSVLTADALSSLTSSACRGSCAESSSR